MTRKKVGPFRGGRKRKLTPAQQVELLLLAAELRELGPMRRAVDQAKVAWLAKKKLIGTIGSWAYRYGVSKGTISDYIHGGHKWDVGLNGYSATSLRALANGIAAADGTAKPATGATAAAPSTNSGTSTTTRLRLSVQNVEIEYER